MSISTNSPDTFLSQDKNTSGRALRVSKTRKPEVELIAIFWTAPMEAFFGQETVALVENCSTKTLECERWRGVGIPYRKVGGRVLYQKKDVVQWLESHKLVRSTSEYMQEVGHG